MGGCRRNGTKAGEVQPEMGRTGGGGEKMTTRWRKNDNNEEDGDDDNVCDDSAELNCERVTMREQVEGLQRRKVQRNPNTRLLQIEGGRLNLYINSYHHEYNDSDDNHRIDDCPYDGGGGDQSGIIEARSLKARGSSCSNALTSHSLR